MSETHCNRCGSRWHTDCADPANVEPVNFLRWLTDDEDGIPWAVVFSAISVALLFGWWVMA